MAIPDSALSPQIDSGFMAAYLDGLDGTTPDPIRAVLAQADVTIPAGMTGDAAFDGHTFSAIDPAYVDVSAVALAEGGSDTVTISFSALIAGDAATLNQLSNPANFRGRIGKLLIGIQDANGTPVSTRFYYVGYMMMPEIAFDPASQRISLSLENYLNVYSGGAPSRSLLSQRNYDSGDLSANATAGAANSASGLGVMYSSTAAALAAQTAIRIP